MKTNLKKALSAAVLGATMFSAVMPTWAGEKDLPTVEIGSTWASGSMVGARYSGDSKQYIGCTSTMSWAGPWTSCFARDKTGTKYFLCGSGDPKWLEVTQTMTDSSYLYLVAETNYGACKYISVENKSSHLK
jgi:hypothetical protein